MNLHPQLTGKGHDSKAQMLRASVMLRTASALLATLERNRGTPKGVPERVAAV